MISRTIAALIVLAGFAAPAFAADYIATATVASVPISDNRVDIVVTLVYADSSKVVTDRFVRIADWSSDPKAVIASIATAADKKHSTEADLKQQISDAYAKTVVVMTSAEVSAKTKEAAASNLDAHVGPAEISPIQ